LITKRQCRIVNICSATGFFAIPNTCAYSTSKYALESFSDCLRREMSPWDLKISIIEPGTLRTPMNEGYAYILQNLWNELSTDIQERWGIDFLNNLIIQGINSPIMKHPDDPKRVVQAVQHAVMNINPCIRYRPGWQAKLFFIVFYLPPTCSCDTAFGNGLDIELDKQDFNVLSGVYLPNSVASLREKLLSKATVFRLDITKQETCCND
ncbi:unnamed protein product, partial [Rotaria sp. Silwood1]